MDTFDLRPEKYVTLVALAKRLGCSEAALWKRVKAGKLGKMIGKHVAITEAEAATVTIRSYRCRR